MKYVSFQELKIKNFLSVGEEQVVVKFTKGLHIITGINRDKEDRRNGVGKSTIADALYFAIFGSTLRDIKKDFISNNLTDGTCEVQLSFNVNSTRGNDDFTIVRSLNPSKLHIFKNGIDKTRDSIANTTEYIEAVLSSSPEVFQNCVIMTLNNTLPFMAKSKIDKRKFIEQVFNLQIFSEMLSKLREEHNEVKRSNDIELTKHNEVTSSIQMYERQKETKIKDQANQVILINGKISNYELEVQELSKEVESGQNIDTSNKIQEIETVEKAYDSVQDKIKEIIAKVAELNSDAKQKIQQISKIGTAEDVCPTCLRPIETDDRDFFDSEKKRIRSEVDAIVVLVADYNKESTSLKDKSDRLKAHISKLNGELNSLKVKIENNKNLTKRITDLKDTIESLKQALTQVSGQDNSINDIINNAKDRLQVISVEIDKLKKSLNLLDVVKFVVSEEGVKSYIVKKILQSFNSKLAYYLKKLDSNSICIFDEYFDEEILNEKGKVCSYNNFSGAERKAIDLACLFSFMDMRKSQGDVHYNISIYDELFDSSLDEKGVELVLEILKERSDKFNEGIFIISHRKESIKAATGDIIFLEKHNGVTRRVNFVD
jgi:DNA repair exonuclease SbcCD ATPase subunit